MRFMTRTESKPYDVLIVGAGAAGMTAALFAARAGASVCLLDKNAKTGVKMRITGKGRCNITNACTVPEFLTQVLRNNKF